MTFGRTPPPSVEGDNEDYTISHSEEHADLARNQSGEHRTGNHDDDDPSNRGNVQNTLNLNLHKTWCLISESELLPMLTMLTSDVNEATPTNNGVLPTLVNSAYDHLSPATGYDEVINNNDEDVPIY
uniref:Uncharacterized protein n=1 Tax=Amphimedon queenslandica TaxID=400682 RepID=A0A1X7THB8_AMPQE